jgi:hypothetical protein
VGTLPLLLGAFVTVEGAMRGALELVKLLVRLTL